MSIPFLITGLPRSRTAWMAEFMTTASSVCFHEPLRKMYDVSGLSHKLMDDEHKFAGASDSGAGYFLPWILTNLQCPVVIIDRHIDEVDESMRGIGFSIRPALELLKKEINTYGDHPNVMRVKFENLHQLTTMQKIFWHLMPGEPFDEGRFERFDKVIVEVNVDEIIADSILYKDQQQTMLRGVISCLGSHQQ